MITLWHRVKLFFHPPQGVQPEVFSQEWMGVTVPWLNAVEERFEHQNRRAEAMKILEEKAGVLKGERPAVFTKDSIIDSGAALKDVGCPHEHRVAEHVQMCADCNLILKHDERVMIEPGRMNGLLALEKEWEKIALYLRANYAAQIERGDHAGISDSDVIIGYLSRGKAGIGK